MLYDNARLCNSYVPFHWSAFNRLCGKVAVRLNSTDDWRYFLFHRYLKNNFYWTRLEIFINQWYAYIITYMYLIKIRNTTSAVAPLVSLRDRLRQALTRCLRFFHPVFSKTPATQTVNGSNVRNTSWTLLYLRVHTSQSRNISTYVYWDLFFAFVFTIRSFERTSSIDVSERRTEGSSL